ncbi:hypothetical protein, partial [Ruegeria faecimaris]|uniref:hypothetical protein n=1 Tax=Ruegeria faecimaris TaxID=686389 RepID=UPI002491EBF3
SYTVTPLTECCDAMSQVCAMLYFGTETMATKVQMIAITTELVTDIFYNLSMIEHVKTQSYYEV